MSKLARKIETGVNRWLTTPEANAAGRLGLYRIIFALVALAHVLTPNGFLQIPTLAAYQWKPVFLLLWLKTPPPLETLVLIEAAYIFGLVLLAVGLRVRLTTLLVLIAGTFYSAITLSFGKIDHGGTFMYTYIPAVMLFAPWGATFSLDAVLRARRGIPAPSPREDSLRYSWPILFLLWLLCIMFMMSGVLKGLPPGQWILNPNLMGRFMLEYNITPTPSELRYFLAGLPLVPTLLQACALIFETLYPLAAINKTWRRFYLSSTVFFHIGTQITMGIWFTPMLFTYLLFFDFYALYERWFPKRLFAAPAQIFARWASPALIGLTIALGAVVAGSHYLQELKPLLSLPLNVIYGLAWYVATPIAAYGLFTSAPKLVRDLWRGVLRRGKSAAVIEASA